MATLCIFWNSIKKWNRFVLIKIMKNISAVNDSNKKHSYIK